MAGHFTFALPRATAKENRPVKANSEQVPLAVGSHCKNQSKISLQKTRGFFSCRGNIPTTSGRGDRQQRGYAILVLLNACSALGLLGLCFKSKPNADFQNHHGMAAKADATATAIPTATSKNLAAGSCSVDSLCPDAKTLETS